MYKEARQIMQIMLRVLCILSLMAASVYAYNLLGPPKDPESHSYCRGDNIPGVPGCPCDERDWDDWGAWSACSRTCGGGSHTRCRRERCGAGGRCCSTYCFQDGDCNTICYNDGNFVSGRCVCPTGVKGFCCECASPLYCKTPDEWYYCDAAYNSYCHECQNDAYYLIHATEQCGVCSMPRYCKTSGGEDVGRGDYWCHELDPNGNCVPPGSCCRTCQNTTASDQAYYLDVGITNQCTPKCNWLGHWCWPGVCDDNNNYLATTCNCSAGFVPDVPNDEITKCRLVHPPDIVTCRLGAESVFGEAANSTFKDNSTSCESTEDVHINFETDHMFFEYSFSFDLPKDPPSGDDRHSYVESFAFGVVHASDTVSHYDKLGNPLVLDRHDPSDYPVQGMCSVGDFNMDNPLSGMLITCRLNHHYGDLSFVGDGEKLCHLFDVTSSGYVDIHDRMFLEQPAVRHYYDQIETMREVCFLTDFTAPNHCVSVNNSCQKDVLNFGKRIRRDLYITATFDGWFDPDPGSIVVNASGIKLYEIEVRNVIHTPTELYADFTSIQTYKSTGEDVNITLPDREEPSMYGIYLWVLDGTQEGPNFQISRRFVLTDNSSYVELNEDHPLFVATASSDSDLEWQTHLNYVKLYWSKHFYNTWHVHTNLLLPIRTEGNMSISGPFEQETGELPVSGTPNVDGIVNFQYGYHRISVIDVENEPLKDVPDALTEKIIVTDFEPLDGDVIEFRIKAIDIMNNTLDDNVTIMIDSSAPLIKDMFLIKDGYAQIFVHNSTDLSEMEMTFKSYDPHSGLQSMGWKLGTKEGMDDIGSGHLPVLKFQNESCIGECYCPAIGQCEQYNYTVPLFGLVANDTHVGNHNREYHFTFTTMNEAHLITIEKIMILVDVSPPEIGHVFDSPPGTTDRNFQSVPLLHFHWNGFIDHESGISKYHIVISGRCFSKEEMQYLHTNMANLSDVIFATEHIDTYITFEAESPGFYRISVIAFNGAMDPSDSVCSSGIVYDNTPPVLSSVQLIDSVHQQSILCSDNSVYFVSYAGVARRLSDIQECFTRCEFNATFKHFRFPISHLRNGTVYPDLSYEESRGICETVPVFSPPMAIFLRTDTFHLIWSVIELDSQMHDYFVGIASDIDSVDHPDIKGYKSTHNKTDYKCTACGIGQGEEIYLALKGVNKAVLTEILPVGPVIIDSTPPMYTDGMQVRMDVDHITISWQFDSFVDADYDDIFTEYEWALGITDSPGVIQTWTTMIFPFNFMDNQDSFSITVPRYQVEVFDQGRGLVYIFSLKCFNRARLFSLVTSEPFQVYQRRAPSEGVVQHTAVTEPDGKEIGFQEQTNILCVRWFGFTHSSENLTFALSIGTSPKWNDIISFVNISSTKYYCIKNVTLQSNAMYYVTVRAVAGDDFILVSSRGIYIATEYDIVKDGTINSGGFCPDNFQHVIYTNTSTDKTADGQLYNEFQASVNLSKESIPYVTLRLKFDSQDITIRDITKAFYEHEELTIESWTIAHKYVFLYYNFIQMYEIFDILVLYQDSHLLEVSLHHCHVKSNLQIRSNSIPFQWSFSYPHMFWITHSQVFLSIYNENQDVRNESSELWNVGKHNKFTLPIHLTQGESYTICVKPCFHTTCITKGICQHFAKDSEPPRTGTIEASLDTTNGIRDTQLYKIRASWEPFVNYGISAFEKIHIYDWTISQDQYGTGQTVEWSRLLCNETEKLVMELETEIYLHVYKHKTLYFTLRAVNTAGVSQLVSIPMVLHDIYPASGAQVFDLAADYNLDSLKDFLHSSNLGNMTKVLHDDDVDFTSYTEGISGAILGVDCGQYSWAIQTSTKVTCTQKGEVHCAAIKDTTDNVVRFTMQSFTEGVNYTLCVLGQGKCSTFKACSNGFLIDLHPPIAGYAEIGADGKSISSDASSIFTRWSGFSDLEEEVTIPYGHGIKHYEVCLGSAPMGDDIMSSMLVGLSTHVYLTNLKLPLGRHFYSTVKACDHVELCTAVSSNPAMVDTTAPVVGSVYLSCLGGGRQSLYGRLLIWWGGVKDTESGIQSVEVAVGQTSHSQEIYPYTTVNGTQIIISTPVLKDGTLYYSHIKVTNRAGIWTIKSSEPLLYDSSPPEKGFIKHGLSSNENDDGWSQNDTAIAFHWEGFEDPHSGVFFYRIALGIQPHTEDVVHWTDVGQKTFVEKTMRLDHGLKYYLTVECCNTVLLCIQAFSSPLIVDTSPPIPGVIKVGIHEEHQSYQYSSDSLIITWIGFQDLQSEISHFDWCIESTLNTCDIHPIANAYKANHVTPHGLQLPLLTPLFVRVIAYNNVGLNVTSWSKEFIVDTSKPLVQTKTQVVTPSSLKPYTQFDRSYISVHWSMTDNQSPMIGYYVSIQSHHDGIAPLMDYAVGNINEVTIPLSFEQQFQDGSVYTVKVTGCNAAELCTTSIADNILVDSSPPLRGGFVEPMTWRKEADGTIVNLLWMDFSDPHSDIANYYLTISSNYNGDDLSKGILKLPHDITKGPQHNEIALPGVELPLDELIYITVWAENGVGLLTSAAKISLFVLPDHKATSEKSGILDIQKHSCDVEYCNYDCTCAIVNGYCTPDGKKLTCNQINDTSFVEVFDGIDGQLNSLTPSSVCLPGYWINNNSSIGVTRYEWSVSMVGLQPGFGVFDRQNEKYLFDVEMYDKAVYCTSENETFLQGQSYMYHVNAWHNFDEYSHFVSLGVRIDTSPPHIGLGRHVLDKNDDFSDRGLFTSDLQGIYSCWENVFSDTESGITGYLVSIGTSQGGNEIIGPVDVGLTTNISLPDILLLPGYHYYTTVSAFNGLNMTEFAFSRGFITDVEPPYAGNAFVGLGFHDKQFQSGSSIEASWHGFADKHSYIMEYLYTVTDTGEEINDTDFISVHLANQVNIKGNFRHGHSYQLHVMAVDAALHESEVVTSHPVVIDNTPPIVNVCMTTVTIERKQLMCICVPIVPGHSIKPCECRAMFDSLFNPGEMYQISVTLEKDPSNINAKMEVNGLAGWMAFTRVNSTYFSHSSTFVSDGLQSISNVIYTDTKLHESTVVHLEKCTTTLSELTENLPIIKQVGELKLLISVPIYDLESGLSSVEVGIGTSQDGLQLLPYTNVGHENSVLFDLELQHGLEVHAIVIARNFVSLKTVVKSEKYVIDWTPPVITSLDVQTSVKDGALSVSVFWTPIEEESVVTDCSWAIGYLPNTEDILPWQPTETLFNASTDDVEVVQGDIIFVTIACCNPLSQCAESVSLPTRVVLEPPKTNDAYVSINVQKVNVYEPTADTQASLSGLEFQYHGFEDNSGLRYFEYQIRGSGTAGTWINASLQDYMSLPLVQFENGKVYIVDVHAVNAKGFQSANVEDSVLVLEEKPYLTGKKIQWTFMGNTLNLDWEKVFFWRGQGGDIVYEVYAGSQEGASDLSMAKETKETTLVLRSGKLQSPATCFCFITAIAPSGLYQSYSQTIYL